MNKRFTFLISVLGVQSQFSLPDTAFTLDDAVPTLAEMQTYAAAEPSKLLGFISKSYPTLVTTESQLISVSYWENVNETDFDAGAAAASPLDIA